MSTRALAEERGLAPTTIATMLKKMEAKGVVTHRTEGRKFLYRPTVSEADVRRTMVGDLTERLFRGEVTALVSHLLAEHEIDPDELRQLEALLAESTRRKEPDMPSLDRLLDPIAQWMAPLASPEGLLAWARHLPPALDPAPGRRLGRLALAAGPAPAARRSGCGRRRWSAPC